MNRRYTTGRFGEIVELCRSEIEDVAIGIDILAGFPGETEDHFLQTYSFLEKLDFTYLHVFPYSRRPGTPAADFADQIAGNVKDRRVARLRGLGEEKKRGFYRSYQGSVRSLLVEGARDRQGRLKGFTDNYIPVAFTGEDNMKNRIVDVMLEKCDGLTVNGKIMVDEHER